jgi:RNA polymerase sigma-70 factor (ECF subfamily)
MESPQKPPKPKIHPRKPSGSALPPPVGEKAVNAIVAERARFLQFVAAQIGDDAAAEDVMQESLLRALEQSEGLRRGESAVAWFYRILRNAISDHFREKGSRSRRMGKFFADLRARGEDVAAPPSDWDAAVCACFHGLLPALKPRYADVIRRIDLRGESKREVGRDLKIKPATLDVVLHRARHSLRRQLEVFCGSCSRESCLACFCQQNDQSLQ